MEPGRLIEAANIDNGRFKFLRRRNNALVKAVDQSGIDVRASDPPTPPIREFESEAVQNRRFISFSLRKRAKSDDNSDSVSTASTSTFTFTGLISNALSSLVKYVDIDELEHQFNCEQQDEMELKESRIKRREQDFAMLRDEVNFKKYSEAFDRDSEKDDDEARSEVGSGSGISVNENNNVDSSIYDKEKNVSCEDGDGDGDCCDFDFTTFQAAIDNLDQEVFTSDDETEIMTELVTMKSAGDSIVDLKNYDLNHHRFTLECIDKVQTDYAVLSDSDSESWEKVEKNIIENVQVLVQKPVTVDMLKSFSKDKNTIIEFLASVFIKLARRIFFKPATVQKVFQSGYFEDFVFDFPSQDEEEEKEAKSDKILKEHKFLDFETAHRILFYNEAKDDQDDWCLLLPDNEDFIVALDFLSSSLINDLSQIDIDLNRLPQRFYDFYAEKMGRERQEEDMLELQEKVRLVLAFIMIFESKELSLALPEAVTSPTSPVSNDQQILYTQGFDQVAAYFAINFDLDQAGPIAYRFFQLYMSELINFDSNDLNNIRRKIDARAVKMIRGYLRDKMGSTVLDFEPLLGILELYPFSNCSATILYFTSATTWADLDRLIQFLLLKVPQDKASKSVSLLAAANMLYSMLALDELFAQEIGSQEWTLLKVLINKSNDKKRFEILDSLVLRFMADLFLNLRDKIVHAGKEFDDFLLVAESLIPYLHEFN